MDVDTWVQRNAAATAQKVSRSVSVKGTGQGNSKRQTVMHELIAGGAHEARHIRHKQCMRARDDVPAIISTLNGGS